MPRQPIAQGIIHYLYGSWHNSTWAEVLAAYSLIVHVNKLLEGTLSEPFTIWKRINVQKSLELWFSLLYSSRYLTSVVPSIFIDNSTVECSHVGCINARLAFLQISTD